MSSRLRRHAAPIAPGDCRHAYTALLEHAIKMIKETICATDRSSVAFPRVSK
jgi:hypothetical protein